MHAGCQYKNQLKPAKLCYWLPGPSYVNEPRHGEKLGAHVHAIAKGRPCNLHSYYTSPRPREDQTALTLLNLSCANPQTEDRERSGLMDMAPPRR